MARAPFGFAPWPVVPTTLDDEATPVGLAPGQMPADPRRDGSVQPTAAGKKLSSAVGGLAGGIAQGLLDAAKLPGDVYAGRVDPMSDQGIGRAFDLAGTLATGGMPMAEAGAAGIFGGRLAATADREALKRAEGMAASGADRRAIWDDTGWFQGPDTKWRFEIPDDKAGLASPGPFAPPGYSRLQHDALAGAYPETWASTQQSIREAPVASGRYERDSGTLFAQAPTPKEQTSIALHEVQHILQGKEGFARGSNPRNFTNSDWEAAGAPLSPGKSFAHSQADWSWDQYHRTAGEVEARNVQARANLTPDQRRATPPWETQDVPDAEQIVRSIQGGPEMSSSGPIRAYHGSPHSFDRFDVSKLGTGEGAQAFGHGLYFAENEAIARSYRDALSSRAYTANGKPITDPIGVSIAQDVVDHGVPFEQYIGNREHNLNNVFAGLGDHPALATMRQELSRARELQNAKLTSGSQGHMYEVAIDADPRSFLDFDRPLAGQDLANLRDVVRPTGQMVGGTGPEAEVIRRLQTDPRWQGGWDEDRAWRHLRDAYPSMDDAGLQRVADGVEGMVRGSRAAPPIDLSLTGGELLRTMDRQNGRAGTAKILHDAGIPGVRYLDASARGTGDGTRNIVTFGDDLVSIVRKYGIPGAVGAGGTAAALTPGDAQAAPSPSGAPMAAGARAFSFMPTVDEYGRPIPGTAPTAPASEPAPARTAAPPPVPQVQQEQAPPIPLGWGVPQGFGPGSAGAGLPLPPQEPASTGPTAPAMRSPARPTATPTPAPSGTMTSAPLPPARPPEFSSSADPGPPLDIKPKGAAATAAPAGPSAWDGISNFLGNNSDMLIGIGTGLLSTPGIGRGLAAGVQQGVAMQNASAAQGLARAKQAVEMQKLAREQGGITANAGLLKRAYPGVTDEQAAALAATPSNVQEALKILRDPNHGTGAPNGFRVRADGQGYEAIAGGPQDPATKERDAAATARGTAAGKPDETYTLLPEERRVAMGLPAGSYQVDSKNKVSPVNPTGTTINMGAEKAQDAKVGGGYGDYQLDLATKGRNAASTLNTLALMEQAMRTPGFYSGVGGDGVKRANQFLGALGVKDSKAASGAEVFDALSNKVVLDGLGGSLGPGISNTDRDYISRTAPTLQQSEEGNRALIGIARSLAQRQQAVAKLARDYATKNGGRIDGGFDQALEEFAASNPLFPQAAAGISASPPQEAPRNAPQGTRRGTDGMWYAPDPNRPGKFLRVEQ